jgi:hypothetical protein
MFRIIRSEEIISDCSGYRIQALINGDYLNNIRLEASRHFRNKMREYLKELISSQLTARRKER